MGETLDHHSIFSRFSRPAYLYLALIILTAIAYAPSVSQHFLWDDDAHAMSVVSQLGRFELVWTEPDLVPQYYPLTNSVFFLEHRLFSANAVGYRCVNIALHAFNACLLVMLLKRLGLKTAWAAGFLFALHPLAVESGAWISEHKNTLSLSFYLLAAMAYLGHRAADEAHVLTPPTSGPFALALMLFIAALASKTTTATWPAAMLVIVWWANGSIARTHWLRLLPLFALGVAAGWMTARIEASQVGVSNYDFGLSPLDRLQLAGQSLGHYLRTLLWPIGLNFNYAKWNVDATHALRWLPTLLLLLAVILLWWFRRRLGRGPLAALLLFAGSVLPALGFVDVYPFRFSWVADHFVYLALPVGVTAICGIAAFAMRKLPENASISIGIVVIAAMFLLSAWRAISFADNRSLCLDALGKNPASWFAMNILAAADEREHPESAAELYRAAIAVHDHAEARRGLSNALAQLGDIDGAIEQARLAIELAPWSGEHRQAYIALLRAASHVQTADAAQNRLVQMLRDRLAEHPGHLPTQLELLNALRSRGELAELRAEMIRQRPWLIEIL